MLWREPDLIINPIFRCEHSFISPVLGTRMIKYSMWYNATSTFPRKLLITATITSDFYEANDKLPHFPLWLCYKDQKIKKKEAKKKLNWAKGILAYQHEDWLEFFQVNIGLNITLVKPLLSGLRKSAFFNQQDLLI